jgi:hypothetical protein
MSDLMSSITGFLSNDGKALNSILGLAGTGANIYSGIQNISANNQAIGAQKYVTDLMENPAKMTAAAAQYAQPLSAGLTSDISNQVQANLAERGLGSSPAAYTQQLTQAIAPYIQQNQQTAMQQLLQTLGLAPKPTTSPTINMSSLLAGLKGGSTASPASTGSVPAGQLDYILSEMENVPDLSTSSPDLSSFLIPEAA